MTITDWQPCQLLARHLAQQEGESQLFRNDPLTIIPGPYTSIQIICWFYRITANICRGHVIIPTHNALYLCQAFKGGSNIRALVP